MKQEKRTYPVIPISSTFDGKLINFINFAYPNNPDFIIKKEKNSLTDEFKDIIYYKSIKLKELFHIKLDTICKNTRNKYTVNYYLNFGGIQEKNGTKKLYRQNISNSKLDKNFEENTEALLEYIQKKYKKDIEVILQEKINKCREKLINRILESSKGELKPILYNLCPSSLTYILDLYKFHRLEVSLYYKDQSKRILKVNIDSQGKFELSYYNINFLQETKSNIEYSQFIDNLINKIKGYNDKINYILSEEYINSPKFLLDSLKYDQIEN